MKRYVKKMANQKSCKELDEEVNRILRLLNVQIDGGYDIGGAEFGSLSVYGKGKMRINDEGAKVVSIDNLPDLIYIGHPGVTDYLKIKVPPKYLIDTIREALRKGESVLELQKTDIEESVGPPDSNNYQWCETNQKKYIGRAIIHLKLKEGTPRLSYELPEHNNHLWNGW